MSREIDYIELQELADFVRGPFGGSLKKDSFVESGYAVYEQQHAINNQFSDIRYFITEEKYQEMIRFAVKESDIIMSCSGTMGKVAIVPFGILKGIINQALLKITPKENLLSRFLELYMSSPLFQYFLNKDAKGAAIKNVASVKELKKILIPNFSVSEQQQIVEKLDQAFELIDQAKVNIEQNIINAKELFQSKLDEVFSQKGDGWEESKLQDICEKITDGTHQTPKYFEEGYIFLSSKNVTSGKIDWDNVKYIDEVQHQSMYSRVAPKIGDILLAKNGTTGVAAIVDRDEVFDIYVSLAWIRSKGDVLPEFLLRYINSPLAKKQFNARLKGIGVPNLHLKEIREVIVRYPVSKEQQVEYADYIQNLDNEIQMLISTYNQKIAILEELRKSILEKAFRGELTN